MNYSSFLNADLAITGMVFQCEVSQGPSFNAMNGLSGVTAVLCELLMLNDA